MTKEFAETKAEIQRELKGTTLRVTTIEVTPLSLNDLISHHNIKPICIMPASYAKLPLGAMANLQGGNLLGYYVTLRSCLKVTEVIV